MRRFVTILCTSIWLFSAQAQTAAPMVTTPGSAAGIAPASTSTLNAGQAAGAGLNAAPVPPTTGPQMSTHLGAELGKPGTAASADDSSATDAAANAEDSQDTNDFNQLSPGRVTPGALSQFQRYVRETTGLLLRHFGSELFAGAANYRPDLGQPVPAGYILGPGDEIQLQVWGAVEFGGRYTINREGRVTLPKVGPVTLAGVSVEQLEALLRARLARVFTNFELSATLGRLRSIQVYVVGHAQRPGALQVPSISTLVNAIFASGGPTAIGSMRNIQLKRNNRLVTTLDLYAFIVHGDKTQDAPLQPGDVIVIPPAGPRVAVVGALDVPAIYELKSENDTLGDVLTVAGGVPAVAETGKAILERIDRAQTPPRTVKEIALDSQGLRTALRSGDVVTLFGISPAFRNAVTLQGNVAAPIRYAWFPGMRLLDLIPEQDALITADYYRRKNLLGQNRATQVSAGTITARVRLDQINWEYAVIERLNRDTLATELIPFNLGKLVLQRDPEQNLPLQPGDVVTVFSHNDIRLPQSRVTRLVRVEGEVAAPGVYPIRPGETLPQLLARIGGLTPNAYLYGIEFMRESVRQRQQENLDKLIRTLETQAEGQINAAIANLGPSSDQQAQVLLTQQRAQLQAQIARLKTMRSNGRVALELDPGAQSLASLPALPLEDGDHIVVPAVPGFVAAFGAVYNENVFIHKPGKTVRDVIATAGLTDDADFDNAFVLRADGTVVARRERRGFFGSNFDTLELMPGDTLVVPTRLDRETSYNFITRVFKDWTQILSNFGLGVAAIKSIRNL